MTKAELIQEIKRKVSKKAKSIVKKHFYGLLEHSTKADLEQILKNVRVSRDGYDIRTGLD